MNSVKYSLYYSNLGAASPDKIGIWPGCAGLRFAPVLRTWLRASANPFHPWRGVFLRNVSVDSSPSLRNSIAIHVVFLFHSGGFIAPAQTRVTCPTLNDDQNERDTYDVVNLYNNTAHRRHSNRI
jgi:hypothetical protein